MLETLLLLTKLGIALYLYAAGPNRTKCINTHTHILCFTGRMQEDCQYRSRSDNTTNPVRTQAKNKKDTQQSCATFCEPVKPKYVLKGDFQVWGKPNIRSKLAESILDGDSFPASYFFSIIIYSTSAVFMSQSSKQSLFGLWWSLLVRALADKLFPVSSPP